MQRSTSALVLAVTFLVAACGTAASSPKPPPVAVRPPSPVTTVAKPSALTFAEPSASSSPSVNPTLMAESIDQVPAPPAPVTAPAPEPLPLDGPFSGPDTVTVRTYFMLEGDAGVAGLVPVLRELPMSESIDASSVDALLAGPSPAERAAAPGISTSIPEGTRLLGLTFREDLATVNLSREFEAPGDRMSALGRLGQIVYTLTVYPWVRKVEFQVEGTPLATLADGDVVLSGPIGRADARDVGANAPFLESVLPTLFVDGPSWGETLYGSALVHGTARLASDRFTVALIDAAGQQLSKVWAVEPCPGPCGGGFEARIDFSVAEPQWGSLRVTEVDATGQSILYALARDYPVWLIPVIHAEGDDCGC